MKIIFYGMYVVWAVGFITLLLMYLKIVDFN